MVLMSRSLLDQLAEVFAGTGDRFTGHGVLARPVDGQLVATLAASASDLYVRATSAQHNGERLAQLPDDLQRHLFQLLSRFVGRENVVRVVGVVVEDRVR